jgi:hypothetical protein
VDVNDGVGTLGGDSLHELVVLGEEGRVKRLGGAVVVDEVLPADRKTDTATVRSNASLGDLHVGTGLDKVRDLLSTRAVAVVNNRCAQPHLMCGRITNLVPDQPQTLTPNSHPCWSVLSFQNENGLAPSGRRAHGYSQRC